MNKLISPFFVVGCGRSGTTLLRTMLNHHPEIAIPPESIFIVDYLKSRNTTPINTLQKLIHHEAEILDWGIKISTDDIKGVRTARELIDTVNEIYMKKHNKVYWGQKTPRFIRHWKLLKKTYPQAKFIHVIRDPRAVANSLTKSNVHNSNPYFATKRWILDVSHGIKLKEHYPNDVLEIQFETLINNPTMILKTVSNFLGIRYSPKMLEYHRDGTEEYSTYHHDIHKNLNEKPNIKRLMVWKKALSQEDIQLVESLAHSLMNKFGYKPVFKHPSVSKQQIIRYKALRLSGFVKQLIRYLRFRKQFFLHSLYRKWKLGLLRNDISEINY